MIRESQTMNLFIDIDGVLLGKSPITQQPILASHATKFLEFCLSNFDCYWLTTHCKEGINDGVINYLTPYADPKFLSLALQVIPTSFTTFKTEALFGDFLWIDDQPTAYEILYLDEKNLLNRWIQVNTRKNIDELALIIEFLRKYC